MCSSDLIIGNVAANSISGGLGADTLDGGAGNDSLFGGLGNDSILGAAGFDFIEGGDGDDIINGGKNGDTIFGGIGNDFIGGGNGLDSIDGGDGNDTIIGGLGTDTITGGAGADHFQMMRALSANNIDLIIDYTSGQDVIELSAGIFTAFAGQVGTYITTGPNLPYNSVTGALAYDADGAGPGAALVFATLGLTVHPTLIGNDFFIVPSDVCPSLTLSDNLFNARR